MTHLHRSLQIFLIISYLIFIDMPTSEMIKNNHNQLEENTHQANSDNLNHLRVEYL